MKYTFFKLPVVLIIIYYLIVTVFDNTVMTFYLVGHFPSWSQIIEQIISTLYYFFPPFLLILFCSSVVFNRYRIYVVTTKNTLLLCLLVIIAIFINYIFQCIILPPIFSMIASNNNDIYIFHNIIHLSIFHFLLGISIYYGVMLLRNHFQYNEIDYITLNKQGSSKIHLFLFIILFMYINLLMIELLSFSFYELNHAISERHFTYFCGYIILSVIVYFIVRSRFNQQFARLQIASIIKSACLAFFLPAVFNVMLSLITSAILDQQITNYYLHYQSLGLVIVLISIFQLIITIMIIRAVTKRYFSSDYAGYQDHVSN